MSPSDVTCELAYNGKKSTLSLNAHSKQPNRNFFRHERNEIKVYVESI